MVWETGIEPASPAWKAGVLPLHHSHLDEFQQDSNLSPRDAPLANFIKESNLYGT